MKEPDSYMLTNNKILPQIIPYLGKEIPNATL